MSAVLFSEISSSVVSGLVGFVLGLIFHPKLRDLIFYKFIKSPIEINSQKYDLGFGKVLMNEKNVFSDDITLTNNSDTTIRIRKMEMEITADGKKVKGLTGRGWYTSQEDFLKDLGRTQENPKLNRIGTLYSKGALSIDLKPKESLNLTFGVFFKQGLNDFQTQIKIYPDCDYKKSKLTYKVIMNS